MEYWGSTLTLKHPKPQSMVKWIPPPQGWVKINVDARLSGSIGGDCWSNCSTVWAPICTGFGIHKRHSWEWFKVGYSKHTTNKRRLLGIQTIQLGCQEFGEEFFLLSILIRYARRKWGSACNGCWRFENWWGFVLGWRRTIESLGSGWFWSTIQSTTIIPSLWS